MEPAIAGEDSSLIPSLEKELNQSIQAKTKAKPGKYMVSLRFLIERDNSMADITCLKDPGFGLCELVSHAFRRKFSRWGPSPSGTPVRAYHVSAVVPNVQIDISIRSSPDNLPLPFASIVNLTSKTFQSADGEGKVKFMAMMDDSIRISYIGHGDVTIVPHTNLVSGFFYLPHKNTTMEVVTVRTCPLQQEGSISNIDGEKFAGVLCSRMETNARVAVHITTDKEWSKLKAVSFWLHRERKMPKYAVKSPFLISFYEYLPEEQLPGKLLYNKPLFYFPEHEGKQTLEIDSLNLYLPPEGIFVALEFIMDERYQWPKTDNTSIHIYQGVYLDGVFSNTGYDLAFFDFLKNTWKKPGQGQSYPTNRHGTIKFEARFQYCNQ